MTNSNGLQRVKAQALLLLRDRKRKAQEALESQFDASRFDPALYIRKYFNADPWAGDADLPGQTEIIDAYVLALRQQHERAAYEAGKLDMGDLKVWKPGETIKNRIRVEAGHTVGKTKVASWLVNHFYDHFIPSIIYTYAPTWEQIKDLLWKEIASDRQTTTLPGRILETCEIKDPLRKNHFAKGRAANNSRGTGTERVQGQHGKYLMFVLDEAEGVSDFVFGAIDSMTSGGISIVLMLANPRTRTSLFHKARGQSNVQSFRISCLHHPNVVHGKEVVPGAVQRHYVEGMLEKHCKQVKEHSEDDLTFAVDWKPGVIYRPDTDFMFRVLGIAPAGISDKNLITVGRYEGACKRAAKPNRPTIAWIGVDVARFGKDFGTVYARWNGQVWRAHQISQGRSLDYADAIRATCRGLKKRGVERVRIRIDGGGGFGGGVVDLLEFDSEMLELFKEWTVIEALFGLPAIDKETYFDAITEWTADAGEALRGLSLIDPPDELAIDLCEREYEYRTSGADQVKKLEEKVKFRKRYLRSPDDGDGMVLAVAADRLFEGQSIKVVKDETEDD